MAEFMATNEPLRRAKENLEDVLVWDACGGCELPFSLWNDVEEPPGAQALYIRPYTRWSLNAMRPLDEVLPLSALEDHAMALQLGEAQFVVVSGRYQRLELRDDAPNEPWYFNVLVTSVNSAAVYCNLKLIRDPCFAPLWPIELCDTLEGKWVYAESVFPKQALVAAQASAQKRSRKRRDSEAKDGDQRGPSRPPVLSFWVELRRVDSETVEYLLRAVVEM